MAPTTWIALFYWASTIACDTQRAAEPATKTETASPPATTASASPARQAAGGAPRKLTATRKAMGTHIHFVSHTAEGLDERKFERAVHQAMAEVDRLEGLMSSWLPQSEVSRLNRAQGKPLQVSPETFEVIEKSLWASEMSEGTFDITFQALSGLWRFGDAADSTPVPPTAQEVAHANALVDYKQIEIDPKARRVRLGTHQKIGLGGIAKGYIVDRASRVLRQAGIDSFLLRAGGDLYGAGKKPDGRPWVSGIRDPRGEKGEFFAVLELADRAFSTAGDYARAYEREGKRYHHILDPRTGYPASASRSVTVWAKSAFLADAVDDGVFILGPKKGLALVESLPGTGAVIVDKDNKVWVSERLKGKIRILRPPTE